MVCIVHEQLGQATLEVVHVLSVLVGDSFLRLKKRTGRRFKKWEEGSSCS